MDLGTVHTSSYFKSNKDKKVYGNRSYVLCEIKKFKYRHIIKNKPFFILSNSLLFYFNALFFLRISSMDVVVADILSKCYIYMYEIIGEQLLAPTPTEAFQFVSNLFNILYEHSPPIVRTYYNILNNIPIQSDIIPIALALLILYALFSAVIMTVKGIVRLVYGFIRLSIIISILATIICIVLPYISQYDRTILFPFEKFVFSASSGHTLERQPI